MRAVVCPRYGSPDVLRVVELETPTPAVDEVLIRIVAATVSSGDHRIRSLELPRGFGPIGRLIFGVRRPRQPILGTELSGIVERVGRDVTRFVPGDRVFAFPDTRMGCHAEYATMRESGALALAPKRLPIEHAAALSFGGTTALSFLRKAAVKEGDKILVYGASGCVGSAAVQLARHFKATVTGVTSMANMDLVRSLGAHEVIDYGAQDIANLRADWDVVIDTIGARPYQHFKALLAPHGHLLLVAADLPTMLATALTFRSGGRKVIVGPAFSTPDDVRFLAARAEAGDFRPVIDSVYTLETIAEAHRRVASGRKRGNVLVVMGGADSLEA